MQLLHQLTLLLALNAHFTVAVLRLPLARRGPETVRRPTTSVVFKDAAHRSSRTRVETDYTLENPKVIADNGALRPGNRVKLQNFGNVQYIGSVGFGNPPQYVDMAFDTGSSDTWIPGIHCASCSPHHRFDVSKSTTFFDTREKFYDEYGSGSVSGTVGVDSVTVSGFVVTHVRFGVAVAESTRLQTFLADGVFGLGFEHLARITRPTAFAALAEQQADLANMFAFHLTSEASVIGSELHLGGYDLSVVGPNASFHYTPVVRLPPFDSFMYWTIQMNDFSVLSRHTDKMDTDVSNGASPENLAALKMCTPFCYAIVDTGTSLISIPASDFNDVIREITGDNDCDGVYCNAVSFRDFPVLRFGMVPDNVFLLQPQDYLSCLDYGRCTLQLEETSDPYWVLGDVFLKTHYTLFDAEHMRVGFACNGSVCQGGSGDIFGADKEEDAFSAWETAFLLSACFAATSLVLAVFQLHYHHYEDDQEANESCLRQDRGVCSSFLHGDDRRS
uniref:Peptidase A1 domain-containing protein n=1 Tax=Peronospora matthiolae TaxID=2874970 RepID=A0AAV1TBX7_9STRA